MSGFVPPGDCPNCGEEVPAGAAACPGCGADARTGWSDETYLDGIDLADDDEAELGRVRERELGDGLPRGGRAWAAFGLVVFFALLFSGAWWLL